MATGKLNSAATEIHADLSHTEVSLDDITKILARLTADHPEISVKKITEISSAIRETIQENLSFLKTGAFDMVVVGALQSKGILKKDELKEDVEVPDSAVGKLRTIFDNPAIERQLAHIILTAESEKDVRPGRIIWSPYDKLNCYGGDSYQLLMPVFHKLCEIDESVKNRTLAELNEIPFFKDFQDVEHCKTEDYCFNPENTQPYVAVGFAIFMQSRNHPVEEQDAYQKKYKKLAKEAGERFIEIMLNELKSYITS